MMHYVTSLKIFCWCYYCNLWTLLGSSIHLSAFFKRSQTKLIVPKVAYCCFGPEITYLWSKTAESQLKKVIYGLSLNSSVFYPATLGTLSLAHKHYTHLQSSTETAAAAHFACVITASLARLLCSITVQWRESKQVGTPTLPTRRRSRLNLAVQ
jgi:hypothetical protein